MYKKSLVHWTLACASLSICIGASAQSASGEVEWIARTGEAARNESLSRSVLLQAHGNDVRGFDVKQDLLRTMDLTGGRWTTARALNHGLKGSYYPEVVDSFDLNQVYLWSFDEGLRIIKLDLAGASVPVATVNDDRLRNIMNSQSAGRVSGDAVHGFWVSNAYVGTAVFIEPGTWVIHEVPGLTAVPNRQTGTKPMFGTAALGAAGSLWVMERGTGALVRRGPQGQELVRVPWPFSRIAGADATNYGAGILQRSEAGVLAISSTRLEMASIDHTGAVIWRLNVCSSGLLRRCVLEAPQRGTPSLIQRAVGDKAGSVWIVDQTNAVFRFEGKDGPRLIAGNMPPCRLPSTSDMTGPSPTPPCVGPKERLVRIGEGRYLLYSLAGELSASHELRVAPEGPARISFKPLSTALADLPMAMRQAVLNSTSDLRVWGFSNPDDGTAALPVRRTLGIPTPYGIVTAAEMMRKYLSPPGDAIRTPEDRKLAALFNPPPSFEPGSMSMAQLGGDLVVIKDLRMPPTQLAAYNMRTGTLRQGITVTGLPEPTGCQEAQTSLEYVFNDDRNKLYLFREWSGEVYTIKPDFSTEFLGRLPARAGPLLFGCGATTDVALVPVATLTPDSSLVMAYGRGVFVQRGKVFERVAAPPGVRQVIVLSDKEAIAIAQDGLAKLRLAE
jgi:hypothetical protein